MQYFIYNILIFFLFKKFYVEFFSRITDTEFFNLSWKAENPNRKVESPNIVQLVDRFNKVSYWVATEIVMSTQIKDRVNVLKKFISVAEVCISLLIINLIFFFSLIKVTKRPGKF